jgi:hypothetical protein
MSNTEYHAMNDSETSTLLATEAPKAKRKNVAIAKSSAVTALPEGQRSTGT